MRSKKINRGLPPIILFIALLSIIPHLFIFLSSADAKENDTQNKNWVSWGGDPEGTRYSELEQINTSNVNQLELAATIPLGAGESHVSGALIVDGLIYLQEPDRDTLHAYNQSTGKLQWSRKGPKFTILKEKNDNRVFKSLGLAYSDNVIYWYQLSGNLLALNARTGETLWEAKNTQEAALVGGTPPIVVGNKVIVGVADVGFGIRGYLTAYNTADGSIAWRAHSYGTPKEVMYNPAKLIVNGAVQPSDATSGERLFLNQLEHKGIGGGAPAGWISYDPELNLIYYGSNSTMPSYPEYGRRPYQFHYSPQQKQLWSSALWARNADNGELVWLTQMTPDNQWGYQAINESILTHLKIGHQDVKALIHVDQNGFTFVIDRQNGKLISATKTDNIVDWVTGFPTSDDQKLTLPSKKLLTGIRPTTAAEAPFFCPSTEGMKPLQPAAFSKKTGLLYIAGSKKCMSLYPKLVDKHYVITHQNTAIPFDIFHIEDTGHFYANSRYPPSPEEIGDIGGFLKAWDPQQNVYQWVIDEPYDVHSGVLATKGNVIFYGTLEGYFKAVDASTGKLLYQLRLPKNILGNISTWMHQGKQYIGVLSGFWLDDKWSLGCDDRHLQSNSKKAYEFQQKAFQQLCMSRARGEEYAIFSLGSSLK